MEELTVMIVDSSARAHALSDAYERSPNVKRIIVSPGNDFIGYNRGKEVIIAPGKLTDPQSFLAVAQQYKPDLVDVCQDDALAVGTVDLLKENGFDVFGPTRDAARLEWDKAWARGFMKRHGIPHPQYLVFTNQQDGIDFVAKSYETGQASFFIKAAGLCAGKGAIPANSLEEALKAIETMKSFGKAGEVYLIEECMTGEEASVYAILNGNGTDFNVTKPAQDHKRLNNNDEGPNTGGMGAVAPAGLVASNNYLEAAIKRQVIVAAINGLQDEHIPYTGILYCGIMAVERNGELVPKVVEFNSRWGAPEAEVVVPGILTPMDEIAFACVNSEFLMDFQEDDKTRVCVVGASRGYPGDYSAVKNKQIFGLEDAMKMPGITVFGAGIKVADGKFYANGGRLFSLVAEGDNVKNAQSKALDAMRCVHMKGDTDFKFNLHYRTDIGRRDIERCAKGGE